jgi:ppGpp synthetase/RelA/SpoT-type nucleotidyltranferase
LEFAQFSLPLQKKTLFLSLSKIVTMDNNVILDPHGKALMQQYHDMLPQLKRISNKAYDLLGSALREQGIYVTAIEHRVKTEKSLAGKLELKGAKYKSIDDVTDLVGLRVITFYTDEVDKVAAIAKRVFDIDWQESVDKRKLHKLDAFGYNSLHYICRLKEGGPRFELQMRTALQHVWSTIEHDTGYKGDVKIPSEYIRQFSRLAGMLELVDDEFSRLRIVLTDYRRQIQSLVKNGQLDDVPLSADSFRSYLELNPFNRLNRRIAAVNQAEIYSVSLMPYLPVLESLGLETLGDVHLFIEENADDAYQLALSQLAITDLDILSSSAALQYLCLVYVLKHDGGRDGLKSIFDIVNGEDDSNYIVADMMMEQAETLPFMQKRRKQH